MRHYVFSMVLLTGMVVGFRAEIPDLLTCIAALAAYGPGLLAFFTGVREVMDTDSL